MVICQKEIEKNLHPQLLVPVSPFYGLFYRSEGIKDFYYPPSGQLW
jgi:hypothetical protein